MKLEDIVLLAAMGPPGGGKTYITPRLKRHYNLLSYTELDLQEVTQIFGTLTRNFLKKYQEPVRNVVDDLVSASIDIYQQVKAELLPTPSKNHYLFNMRDIWRVIQGICGSSNRYVLDANDVVRLWYHENMRVYHDRLTTESDRIMLKEMLNTKITKFFNLEISNVINAERIIYGDFL